MLLHNKSTETEHVKFISYDGKYPCLCMGKLTLEIDGKCYVFGNRGGDSQRFWTSGGSCSCEHGVSHNEWVIDVEDMPEQFQKYAHEIDALLNENIDYGCCGGCL